MVLLQWLEVSALWESILTLLDNSNFLLTLVLLSRSPYIRLILGIMNNSLSTLMEVKSINKDLPSQTELNFVDKHLLGTKLHNKLKSKFLIRHQL